MNNWETMSRRQQNAILRPYGFKWQKLEYEDAEEELTKWFLVGPNGETWSLQQAFAHIADLEARTIPVKAQSVDLDSPVIRDSPTLEREYWRDHQWRWKLRGDGKYLLMSPGKHMITERELQEAYSEVKP